MKQYVNFLKSKEDKAIIFKHLNDLKELRPGEYAKLVEDHFEDLIDIGYLKRE